MINYMTDTCIVINDGYLTRKADFGQTLGQEAIRFKFRHGYYPLWWEKRSMRSMRHEWAVYNALYNMGLFRKHTKDVNLGASQTWYKRVAYAVAGGFAWLIIR